MRVQRRFLRVLGCTVVMCVLLCANMTAGQGVIPFNRANSGLIDNHVNALTMLQGAPLVATSKGVAWRQTDRWENFRSGENGLPDAPVTSVVVFGGNLWVGTFGKGLARLGDNRWKSFSQTDSGLNDDFVTCLAGWGSRLVVGTREGVSIFDGMLWNRVVLDGVTGPLQITCMAVGREVLLVGTAQGLYFVDSSLKSRVVDLGVSPTPWIQAIVVGSEFNFVAHDAGLAVLHPDGRQAMNGYDRSQVGRIFSLGPIERDVLCATNHGLIRVSPGAGVSRIQLPEFGIAGLAISALIEAGSEWYLGTNGNGVFRVPAERLNVGGGNLVSSGKEAAAPQIVPSGGAVSSSGSGATPMSSGPVSEPPLKLADVRIFPPPAVETGTKNSSSAAPDLPSPGTSGQTAANFDVANPFVKKPSDGGSNPERPGTVPFWTLHKRPTKPSNVSYFKDVLPMVVKKCLACHTTGSGKYFPLNDPKMVVGYFRKAGMGRYEQFSAEGGGMFGAVDPADTELLQIWVGEGCKE